MYSLARLSVTSTVFSGALISFGPRPGSSSFRAQKRSWTSPVGRCLRPHRVGGLRLAPQSEPAVRLSRNGLPRTASRPRSSDRRMKHRRIRQLKPGPAQKIAPADPVALALMAQHANPLPLDLRKKPV